ncbi:MAG: GNAT family N-acetyltransferase [Bryobacteraceae bacterium]|nr:GNAT family N-acetyltransferase [Bryobacteraceae bacterium]
MAAAPNRSMPEVVDLSKLRGGDLDSLLADEVLTWRSTLSWDFTASANLVKRYLAIHSLNGYALKVGSHFIGYCYYVSEERKGLIGDLYVSREWASQETEDLLLSAALNALVSTSGVDRIEAQLMLLHGPFERTVPLARYGQIYPRIFMRAELNESSPLPSVQSENDLRWEEWNAKREDESAGVIAVAYRDHVDGNINDQYRTRAGARRFLHNVVNYPGCGSFLPKASLVALDRTKQIAGLIMASSVAGDVGHITQVCVSPQWKRRGVGYELVRRSMLAMADHGCERASLTVTAANRNAIELYQNIGFRAVRRFAAYVWEGF